MKKIKVRSVDVLIYLTAIFFDSFGIALLIKTDFGATPFGIFITSAALIIPVSVGLISLGYEVIYILAASRISKSRIKFELLIYSGIFAIMIDLFVRYIPSMADFSIIIKVLITIIAVVFIDIAKALFNITIFPKLSVVEFIYALVNRYNFRLDYVQKSISAFNVLCGMLFAWIGGQVLYNVGIGTLLSMFMFGTVLHLTSGPIKRWYERLQ